MPADPRRAKELFVAALDLPNLADQFAFLDRECAGDPELRHRLDALLRAHDHPESVLERPLAAPAATATFAPGEPTADHEQTETAGSLIAGKYKLLERIGEGGMGEVWVAEQLEPIRRRVAIKLIKPGMDSRAVLARFEAERQALALMDHPNIAKVLDAGTTPPSSPPQAGGYGASSPPQAGGYGGGGRPYFVMELVKGVPITEFCDARKLTPRERLELFIPVCQAIQHAHHKGIIHRDIKPSNVLVALHDEKPVPKVIDFGVAKAVGQQLTEKTLYTGFGALVGTPAYMAPEQATFNQLDIDTRADVYALGVLLYELLAGSPPFEPERMKKVALDEVLRLVREEDPPRPSQRLSTSESRASIAAVRQSEPARLSKLLRGELDCVVMKALEKDRNRRYETATGFAMDVQRYLCGEAVQAVPASAGYRMRKFARRNKAGLATAGLVLFFIVLLGGVVGWATRNRAAREQEIAQETARKFALTEEGIRQSLNRGTASRADLHAILKRPGGVQELLNQPARWELLIKTAQGELAQARRLADRAEGDLDAELSQGMDSLGHQLTGDEADYNLARRLEKIRLDTMTRAIVLRNYRNVIAEYQEAFAPFGVLGDDPAAVAVRLAASPIREQLVAGLDEWSLAAFLRSKNELAERLLTLARQTVPDPAWGDRVRQQTVWGDRQSLEKLATQAPTAGCSPSLLNIVGDRLRDLRSPLSEPCLRRAQAQYPADFWLNFNLGHALENTNPAEAVGFYRAALAIRPGTSAVYNNLGSSLADLKRLDEAIDAYHKAIELDSKNAGLPYSNLGKTLHDQGKVAEAVEAFHKAIEIDSKAAYAYIGLGELYEGQKKWQESINAYQKGIEIDPNRADDHNRLGIALYRHGNFKEAANAYQKAIAIAPNYADAHCNLGLALLRLGKLNEAVAACSKAIQINPKHANAHSIRGDALDDLGEVDEAITNYLEAIKLNPNHADAHSNLAHAFLNQGKTDLALDAYRKAIGLEPKNAHFRICCALLLTTCPNPKFRDPREAVEHAKKAVELQPQYGLAWQVLGWAQYRAGDWRACIEALAQSCKLQPGGTGDHSQWIVLALAHARLAEQPGLPEKPRESHKIEARRWYEQADKSIDSKWRVRPGYRVGNLGQPIWDFREEARALMRAKVDKK
jgi:serine/threonine protein kinase/tetratricopeptide (TPR) repeat protein